MLKACGDFKDRTIILNQHDFAHFQAFGVEATNVKTFKK